MRTTLFNGRLNVRSPGLPVQRRLLEDEVQYQESLTTTFGLSLSSMDIAAALDMLDRKGTRGVGNPIFS